MNRSVTALRAFGMYLAAKMLVLSSVVATVAPSPYQIAVLTMAAVALIGMYHRRAWGPLALAGGFALAVVESFPHTLNHGWFELLAALILLRAASVPTSERLRTAVRARLVLQLAILSVFFFSGLQKLAHGQFANGEYLLRAAVAEPEGMGAALRWVTAVFVEVPFVDPSRLVLGPIALPLPPSLWGAATVISMAIVLAEIGLPLMVLARVRGARWLLLAAQVGIGLVSGELSFACSASAAIFLLWPEVPRSAWIGTFAFWLFATAKAWGG